MTANGYKNPFVKTFHDDEFYYIYDVNTNRVVEVDKTVHDIIEKYDADNILRLESVFNNFYSSNELRHAVAEIQSAQKNHDLFSTFRPKKVTPGAQSAEGIKDLHKKGLKQLILELTKTCNLDCSYCPTSGKYAPMNSNHTMMSPDIRRRTLDFFLDRIDHNENSFITFYGGEPLLQFDAIKETVKYVRAKPNGRSSGFNLTTNFTLVNREIMEFLIEHNFYITVSLDGPEDVHDRYRRFEDGTGTFEIIMQNMMMVKELSKEFFARNISILSVLTPPYDNLDDILVFFSSHPILSEIKDRIRSSPVDIRGTTFFEDFDLKDNLKDLPAVARTLDSRLYQAILTDDMESLTIEKGKMFSLLYNLARKPIQKLYEYVHPLGTCHMGLKRVFVDVKGDFYICERSHGEYKIGCIDEGFDYEQISAYYNELENVLDDCTGCWAINHCERCWAAIGNLENFKGKEKERFCTNNKETIEKGLKIFTRILRENPDGFNVFNDTFIA